MCFRDPSQTIDATALKKNCLAEFGGPVSPWVILGDYPGKNCIVIMQASTNDFD